MKTLQTIPLIKKLYMKQILTILTIFSIWGKCYAQTATVPTTNGSKVIVYTKSGTDAALTSNSKADKLYADSKAAAAQTTAIATAKATSDAGDAATLTTAKQYTETLVQQYFQEANQFAVEKAELEAQKVLKSFITLQNGNGIRIDSISPGVYKITSQYSYDPATQKMIKNF